MILSNFTELAQSIVLYPNLASVFALFSTSFVNELFGLLPYSVVLSGQALLIDAPLLVPIISKLVVFVAIPVGAGTAFGSLLIYGLSYLGGRPGIEKFGKRFRLSWDNVEKVKSVFKGTWYDEILFLALRSMPLMPGLPVSAAAGILRMRFAPYLALTALGTAVKIVVTFIVVGLAASAVAT